VSPKEKAYLAIAVIVSAFFYTGMLFSLIGIFYVLGAGLVLAIVQGIAVGQLRGNSVRVSERQFPGVLKIAADVCPRLGIPAIPPIYVMQSGGVLNAFATRFFGRNYVCIYSEVLELAYEQGEEAVAFILACSTCARCAHGWATSASRYR
jgi:Zn-dependent protease with chaperone function